MAQEARSVGKPHSDVPRPRSLAARLMVLLHKVLWGLIGLGLAVMAGRYWAKDQVDEAIRRQVEQVLRTHYKGLKVQVRSARRLAGVGLRVQGVRISQETDPMPPLVEIEELLIECDPSLPELLGGSVAVDGVVVRRLKLCAQRQAGGGWNVTRLWPLPGGRETNPPRLALLESTLEIRDPSQQPGGVWTLRDLECRIQPHVVQGHTWLQFHGRLRGEHLDQARCEGWIDPQRAAWVARGTVAGLEFNPRLRAALPREVQAWVAPLASIRGRTFFSFQMQHGSWDPDGLSELARNPSAAETAAEVVETTHGKPLPPFWYTLEGRIAEGRIDDARLPQPLTEVEAQVYCDPTGVALRHLTARCGQAELQLAGRIEGYDGRGGIDLHLQAQRLPLDAWPVLSLPEAMRRLWERFQPRGVVDLAGRLRFDGRHWHPELEIRCQPIALEYAGFPYPLTDGQGTIRLQGPSASVDLQLIGGGQPVHCRAEVTHPGPAFSGWIEVASQGPLPIDGRLLAALPEPTQPVVRAFRPRGGVQFSARFERPTPGATLQRQIRIQLDDCSIQHERFAYPIDQIQGLLVLEGQDWFFRNLSGRNDSAQIVGEGSWVGEGLRRQLTLQFTAREVPLSDELVQALPPSVQRLWSALQPRGHLAYARVLLRHAAPLGPWEVEVWAEQPPSAGNEGGRTIALEPAAIRYPLHPVTGRLHYRQGEIELRDLRARHGRTTLVAEGSCRLLPGGGYHLELTRCAADHFELDRELRAALAGPLASALTRLPLEGPLHASGMLTMLWPPDPGLAPQVQWNVDLDLENACLLTSTPVAHIHGGIALSGRYAPEGLFTRGELKIDSAMLGPVQLTRLEGPFWSDGQRLVFGMLADRPPPGQPPRQVACRTLGGLLSLDGELGLASEGTFQLQGTLENADLAQIVQELAPHQRGLTGKVFGQLQLGGKLEARHTWQGSGRIHLRDADIYELPLMVALLKLLSIQRPNRTAFTTSDIELRVEGDELALERIDFSGDVVSLKGRGRIHHQQQIDLKFYPLVGREEWHLPVMRPLLGETGRELMLIEVTGTLDQPEIRRVPFPRLDAQWQQLFPELARQAEGRPAFWWRSPWIAPRAALQSWRRGHER